MPNLSKSRLNELKQSKNYTCKDIALKTGIPKSTVEKIFGGFNKNPTIDNLQKIAHVLDCSIDDFFEFENDIVLPFYLDKLVAKLSQYLYDKPQLKKLVDVSKDLEVDDLNLLIQIAQKFTKA